MNADQDTISRFERRFAEIEEQIPSRSFADIRDRSRVRGRPMLSALPVGAVLFVLVAVAVRSFALGSAPKFGTSPSTSLAANPRPSVPGPLTSPSVACGPAPIVKGTYQVQLNCMGAIAAALGALAPGHPPVTSLVFAWGQYCPPRTPCQTSGGVLLETGYVVVRYSGGEAVLIAVHGEPNYKVLVTEVKPLPTVRPE